MAAEIDINWMDRVRLAAAGRRNTGSRSIEPHALTVARVALRGRTGFTAEALSEMARQRRLESTGGSPAARAATAATLIALGALASIAGNRLDSQPLLLCGFGLVLLGVLLCCALVEGWLDPQFGDLTRHMRDGETLATAEQIAFLSQATHADRELRRLIADWWLPDSAPIRRQDLELVGNFQKAKHGAGPAPGIR